MNSLYDLTEEESKSLLDSLCNLHGVQWRIVTRKNKDWTWYFVEVYYFKKRNRKITVEVFGLTVDREQACRSAVRDIENHGKISWTSQKTQNNNVIEFSSISELALKLEVMQG